MSKPKSEQASKEGEVLSIAKSPVVTASLMTSVYDIVHIMAAKGFRRIPIVDSKTKAIQGIVTSSDVVDYLGGGRKAEIIQQQHGGSFYKAINEPVKSIMQPNAPVIGIAATIKEAIDLMVTNGVGGLPIIDDVNRVQAIVTERDLLRIFEKRARGGRVAALMTENVVTGHAGISIADAEKEMVAKSFRRLPLVSDGRLIGIVTAMDIVRFFGSGEVFEHLQSGEVAQVLQTPALHIATRELVTTSPSAGADEAANIMKEKNVGALLVTGEDKLAGILTERDFFKLVSKTLDD